MVKLPLGVHGRTGKRCSLLDERGEAVGDPFESLRATLPIPCRIVMEAPAAVAEAATAPPGDPASARVAAPARAAAPPAEIGPDARKLLDGCGVLGYLAKKARDTAYLDHTERTTLLCILGHLGAEGKAALHAIIGHTYNYSPEVTDRHIGRLPGFPMSCPKVRERHPEAAAVAPCTCRFELRGRGYPTPVLYALKPSQVPAFKKRAEAAASPAAGSGGRPSRRPEAAAASALRREAEALLGKLAELKRHRRGIEGSIARLEGELGALLDRAGRSELQTSLGLLRRLPAEDDEGGESGEPGPARFVIEV